MRIALLAVLVAGFAHPQPVRADAGELTCRQYLDFYAGTVQDEDPARQARFVAYCRAHPQAPARVAAEKTY